MNNLFVSTLAAFMMMSTFASASETGPPSVAIITGEVRNPTSREITFRYDPPWALGRQSEQRVALDGRNRFALEIPVVRGTLVRGSFKSRSVPWKWVRQAASYAFKPGPLVFFVEPGDSLHIKIHPGRLHTSFRFSGDNADNSRFFVEWYPRFQDFQKIVRDSRKMDAEAFSRLADGWRTDQLEFLEMRRTRYAFSPEFVEYATRFFNYTYAFLKISYPENYRRATGRENPDIPPEFHDFLKRVPLVDEKAIGMGTYSTYLLGTLDLEMMRMPPSNRLSDQYDLSSLDLREETVAKLDSLYARYEWHPKLSKMIRLGASDLPKPVVGRLDSLYDNRRKSTLSDIIDLPKLGVPQAAHARLDSFYERSGRSYRITTSSKLKKPEIDTTGGSLVLRLPVEEGKDVEGQLNSIHKTQRLSEMVDLSELDPSPEIVAHLDSLYENRQPLSLSRKLDLTSLGLPQAVQAKLDSIYAIRKRSMPRLPHRIELAEKKLNGRVLYWFLAGELIRSFEYGGNSFELVRRKWRDYRTTNPYPEYNAPVQAALDKAMALQPGRPAPDFTLEDLDGRPVSLSQFRGKVVLLDFWASWCGPCIGNLPDLRRIKKETAGQPVVFLNLSLDSSDAEWRKAIETHQIEGVHVRAGAWRSKTTGAYSVRGIPAYFLVDPQGMILERLSGVGIRDTDAIVAKIRKSLGSV